MSAITKKSMKEALKFTLESNYEAMKTDVEYCVKNSKDYGLLTHMLRDKESKADGAVYVMFHAGVITEAEMRALTTENMEKRRMYEDTYFKATAVPHIPYAVEKALAEMLNENC